MGTISVSGIDENTFLNVYNNNVSNIVVVPGMSEVLDYVKITLPLYSTSFIVTPSSGGNLTTFNFREVFKVLMTNNINADLGEPIEEVDLNNDLLALFTVEYEANFKGFNIPVSVSVDYKAFHSVEQIGETVVKDITKPHLLNQTNLTFFKGYPFDFSLYSNSSIQLNNLNTDAFVLYGAVPDGVNRVYLSRGKYLLDQVDEFPDFIARVLADGGTVVSNPCYSPDLVPLLRDGYNDLRVILNINPSIYLKINLIDACEGVYLKWFNEDGVWDYWLFNNIHKDNIDSKVIDIYNTDFESIETTYFPSLITGKEAINTLDLTYNGLNDYEYKQVKSILTSPRVELFIGNKDDDFSIAVAGGGDDYTKAWMGVRVLNGKITKSNKLGFNDISISIDKKKYTQS